MHTGVPAKGGSTEMSLGLIAERDRTPVAESLTARLAGTAATRAGRALLAGVNTVRACRLSAAYKHGQPVFGGNPGHRAGQGRTVPR